MLTVFNRHHGNVPADHREQYIGRGTPFGNVATVGGRRPISRTAQVAAFRVWAIEKLQDPEHEFTQAMRILKDRHNRGEKIALVCSCHPKACHGDIIVELIEEGFV